MTPAQAAALLAAWRAEAAERAEAEARARHFEQTPDLVLSGSTPPGWLARKMGRLYAEPLQDVRDQVALSVAHVNLGPATAGGRWRVARFMEWRAAARARMADLSCYGCTAGPGNILQFTRK